MLASPLPGQGTPAPDEQAAGPRPGNTPDREAVARLASALLSRRSTLDAPGGVVDLVGRTPCVALDRIGADAPRAALVAKLESRNPGGSLKDRTALGMVLDAEARGLLGGDTLIVEATAGNTGIGLALIGRARGHRVSLVMPARYSSEKARLCEALGASVIRVPGDCAGMRECIEEARRVEADGAVLLNQFENPANPAIHELTTGPEIRDQVGGPIDALVAGVGTGGTLTGIARALLRCHPAMEVVGVEAQGSVIGGGAPGRTRIEGIGNTFVPRTLDRSLMSSIVTVSDDDAFSSARQLAATEGVLAGPSGGAVIFAALGVARRLGPGRRVVLVLPDAAERYWSTGLLERA